jgi:hypothetical protein
LELVEDQEQGGKSIGNRVGGKVGIQHGKHFKTATVVNVTLVSRRKPRVLKGG